MKLIEFEIHNVEHEPRERTYESFRYMQDIEKKDVYLFVFVAMGTSHRYQAFRLEGENWKELERGDYAEEHLDQYTLVDGGFKSADDLNDCYYGNVRPETYLRREPGTWKFMANIYEWSVN
jgi:hypothetical protein